MNFIVINEAIGTCQVWKLPLLEIKTINKSNKQRPYQIIKTSGFGFWSYKRRKRTRNNVFIKSQKTPVSSFTAMRHAKNKEQMYYQDKETCRLACEVRNDVKEPET